MSIENYRVQDKGNVHCDGRRTSFKLFKKDEAAGGFVFVGQFYAVGWGRTDEQCVAYALRQTDED